MIVYACSTGYYDAESHELLSEPDYDERDRETLERWEWAKEHGVACLALWPGY